MVFARLAGVAAVVVLLVVPAAQAATADTAAPIVVTPAAPGPYHVGQSINFFEPPNICTVSCQKIWTLFKPGGPHLGQRMAQGPNEVDWTFTAAGVYTVQFDLSEFCVGTTNLTCDSFAETTLNVDVAPPPVDSTPPTVTASGLVAEATAPATVVPYQAASPDPDAVSTSCSPGSGQAFPVGATPIECTASDTSGNVGHASFTVSVTDTTAPALSVPATISTDATSPAGAAVSFTASATDLVDGAVTPVCSMPSGMTFAIGSTMVACSATDKHGNTAAGSFTVNVAPLADPPASPAPTTPPTTPPATPPAAVNVTPPSVTVPARAIVVPATSPAGAVVRYAVLATDSAGAHVDARCSRASATVFPIGLTTVSCTATDARGNTAQPSVFTVRVKGAPLQVADAVAEARSWNARPALVTRLQQVGKALARPQRACLLIGSLRHDLRGPLGKSVSAGHRARLDSLLARIARVAAC